MFVQLRRAATGPSVRNGQIAGPRLRTQSGNTWRFHARTSILLGALFVVLASFVQIFDAPVVLIGVFALAGALTLFVRPDTALPVTLFLLYINVPAILTKQHGVPAALAGSFILLLGFPLVRLLVLRRQRARMDMTFVLMLCFMVVLLISSLSAVDHSTAQDRLVGYAVEGLLLYWLLINVIRSRRSLHHAFLALLTAGAILGSLSLYQDLTGSYRQQFGGLAARSFLTSPGDEPSDAHSVPRGAERAKGPVDEHNRFAQILIVLLPLAVLNLRGGRRRLHQAAAGAAGLLILGGVAVTMSRGALVTLFILMLVMAFLRWIRPAQLLTAIALLALAVPALSPGFMERVVSIGDATHLLSSNPSDRNQADGAIRGRTTSMLAALHVFRDHPFLGVGPGQFQYYYSEYSQNPEIKFRDRGTSAQRRAHTMYAEIGAESGMIGLGIFLGILFVVIRRLWTERKHFMSIDREYADLATALLLSLAAYLGTAVFLHLSYQRYFWILIALSSAAVHVMRTHRMSVADGQG
jgi:putative inorganic carbon (hco3(-)) transporter